MPRLDLVVQYQPPLSELTWTVRRFSVAQPQPQSLQLVLRAPIDRDVSFAAIITRSTAHRIAGAVALAVIDDEAPARQPENIESIRHTGKPSVLVRAIELEQHHAEVGGPLAEGADDVRTRTCAGAT